MHDKAMRAYCALSLGLVLGGFAACAGTDVPPTDDLEDSIATAYANGAGVAGGAGGSGGSASTAGSGGRAPAAGNGGSAGEDDETPAGGAAGSGGSGGGSDDPGTEPDCDGFEILKTSCGSAGCHGPGSGVGNWAESLEDAQTFIDSEPVTAGCGSVDAVLIDTENPAESLIIQKVDGAPPCGGAMPIVGDKLTDEQISCVQEWMQSL